MQILNLKQGSPEWKEARLKFKCASEAPAVMNASKFMTRNQLLDLKKGWLSNPNSSFKEKLFEKGHEHEDQAREILELEELEDFPALVGLLDDQYLASFDGLGGESYGVYLPWEHKDWNLILAENVRNGVLEPLYYWQLEHQMLVAGCEKIMFTCSDGTEDNRVSMMYQSVPERRADLIAAWKQFDIDLETHEIEAKQEIIAATKIKALPSLEVELVGEVSNSNLAVYKGTALAFIESICTDLQTDQDFEDASAAIKFCDSAEKELEKVKEKALSKTESIDVLFKTIDELKEKMREKRLTLNKLTTTRKKEINNKFIWGSVEVIGKYIESVNKEINPIRIESVVECPIQTYFEAAIKGKRTIESKKNAVDGVIAEFKVVAEKAKENIILNLSTLRELAGEHEFLFNDSPELVKKDNEDLVAVIKNRISEHEEAEKIRLAKIKEEAEAKAKEEAEAKLKAEQEELAQAELIEQQNNQHVAEELSEEKPIEQRLSERFADEVPNEEYQPVAKDIEIFLAKALNCKDDDSEGLINDFGYLLICDDYKLNCEAMNSLRNKFKTFINNS